MTTDFNYNNKTIDSSGPIKPSGTDQPGDPRTRVDFYSDIESIPNPYIGMIVTVKMDETNQNKMTDYKVLSLKSNSLGIANSVIDQVQRYVEYLGAGSVSQDDKNIYANNDMPTVFITSNTLTNLARKEDGKANCEFEIRFKNQIIKCFGTGAIQGTSSAGYPAKNYTFKFYSDKENTIKFNIDVGWGLQNKYCFKKNWVDSTHTRNLSGARIA